MGKAIADGALELASDIISGGTALAGLILVYLGAIASGYDSYEKPQQAAVRSAYRRRAWIGFAGIAISFSAAALGLVGKWMSSGWTVAAGAALLFLALFWGGFTALSTVRDIR